MIYNAILKSKEIIDNRIILNIGVDIIIFRYLNVKLKTYSL